MVNESRAMNTRLKAITEAMAVLNLAGEEVTGRATSQLMYFAGKDLGFREAARYDCTDDIEQALGWVFPETDQVWKVTLWKNREDEDFWVMEGGIMYLRLLFEECPIREACMASGVRLGGVACQTIHGYSSGILEKVFNRQVDLQTEHMGPGACLVVLRTVME